MAARRPERSERILSSSFPATTSASQLEPRAEAEQARRAPMHRESGPLSSPGKRAREDRRHLTICEVKWGFVIALITEDARTFGKIKVERIQSVDKRHLLALFTLGRTVEEAGSGGRGQFGGRARTTSSLSPGRQNRQKPREERAERANGLLAPRLLGRRARADSIFE